LAVSFVALFASMNDFGDTSYNTQTLVVAAQGIIAHVTEISRSTILGKDVAFAIFAPGGAP